MPRGSQRTFFAPKMCIRDRKSGAENLDQINVPDPVVLELTALKERVAELERRLAADSQPS